MLIRILPLSILGALLLSSAAAFITPQTLDNTPGGAKQGALFEQACAKAGLDPAQVSIDSADHGLWGGGKYAPPLLKTFMENPWKISPYTRTMTDQLLQYANDPAKVLMAMHARTGHGVRLGLTGDALEPYMQRVVELGGDNLAIALSELTGLPKERYNTPRPDDDYDDIPQPVRDSTALFCFALPDVLAYRRLALEEPILRLGLNPQEVYSQVLTHTVAEANDEDLSSQTAYSRMVEQLLDSVDFDMLNAGATLLTLCTNKMCELLKPLEMTQHELRFMAETPYGTIWLTDSPGVDAQRSLLLIDTGQVMVVAGAAANAGFDRPVSVCILPFGQQSYTAQSGGETPLAPGCGVFGYAVLADLRGDDRYYGQGPGMGCGIFGSGIVIDYEGNDRYQGSTCGQGCGIYGTGVQIDLAGDDSYEVAAFGQGYGGTLGAGLLLDAAGKERYTALEQPGKENGGPFGAQHFIHFTQGAAYGRRADYTDGHSWAGGVGMLVDGGGDDEYSCDVYGQGTGYWYGLGICVDKGGNDVHRAGWYSLGGSPHFACGVFQDDGGDDRYVCRVMQSLGNARDFSVAWFEDCAGNDYYQGGVMTFGVGDINGLGFFWDKAGDDTYIAKGPCLGQSRIETPGSLRDTMLTLGLFVDGGGADRYLALPGGVTPSGEWALEITDPGALPALEFCGDGRDWTRPADQNPAPGARGGGVDAP